MYMAAVAASHKMRICTKVEPMFKSMIINQLSGSDGRRPSLLIHNVSRAVITESSTVQILLLLFSIILSV